MRVTRIAAYGVFVVLLRGVLLAGLVLTFKTQRDAAKRSPFECGFDPIGVSRLPFCMKFFLVGIIFLVFDVEVALLIPCIYRASQVLSLVGVLTAGTVYEWYQGGLDWIV